jgi:hypothetical protein
MIVLNFGHPLTVEQTEAIEREAGCELTGVIGVPCRLDLDESVRPQLEKLIDSVAGRVNLRSEHYLVNLPSLSVAAAVVLAMLYERSGYLPPILRLKPAASPRRQEFVVAEIVNLQAIRDTERCRRC